ncbi:Protein of unknown function D [Prunus dulcis]|uniref:Secreted protein n=1 Tax=Prunus dulcis TaxID=3755 RepID=A0A5H2XQG7_PRUDU|nr:Protein of unknown function D [Prunus dulcis]
MLTRLLILLLRGGFVLCPKDCDLLKVHKWKRQLPPAAWNAQFGGSEEQPCSKKVGEASTDLHH